MNASKIMPVLGGAAGAILLMLAVLAGTVFYQNQELRDRVSELKAEKQTMQTALGDAQQVQAHDRAMLQQQQAKLAGLEQELEEMKSKLDAGANGRDPRRAVRAQVFAGRQSLGEGWVITGGPNTNAGAVVSLDEQLVRNLVSTVADQLAAREAAEAPRQVTVNNNYSSTPYWGSWYPAGWIGHPSRPPGTNRPPSGVSPSPPTTDFPAPNQRSGHVGVWRPTQQPFLPNPSPWPGTTPMRASPQVNSRVNPALPASQPVLLP